MNTIVQLIFLAGEAGFEPTTFGFGANFVIVKVFYLLLLILSYKFSISFHLLRCRGLLDRLYSILIGSLSMRCVC